MTNFELYNQKNQGQKKNLNIGFHSNDGTFEEFLSWGYEMEFIYNNNIYNISTNEEHEVIIRNWNNPNDKVIKYNSIEEFLNGNLFEIPVKELITKIQFTGLH